MNPRSIISVLIITIITFSSAIAQPGGQQGPPSIPNDKQIEKLVKNLNKELNLDDEQQTQVSEIYSVHYDKVKAKLKNSQHPSRTEMESLESELEKNVKAVLNSDQQKNIQAG